MAAEKKSTVAVVMGSDSDLEVMKSCVEMLKDFDGAITGNDKKKLYIYSGHQETVTQVLVGINATNWQCIMHNFGKIIL